ncbi:MAG TPA: hypothetical protein VMU34_14825 [Mycobacterium sp.]|nr:hypothetical protein [Mycobacterium sp.]
MTISRPATGMARASTTWAARSADGRLETFVVGVSAAGGQALWHIGQTAPGSGWSPWVWHGLPAGSAGLRWSPTVVSDAVGRLQVFVIGDDPSGTRTGGALYQKGQTARGDAWSDWVSLHSGDADLYGSPSVARDADGRLRLFALGSDGQLWQTWQQDSGTGWSEWFSHGNPGGLVLNSAPAAAPGSDGRLEVFIVSEEAALWHVSQTAGGWSEWFCHATPTGVLLGSDSTPAIAPGADGCLQLFTVGNDETLWQISQTPLDGGWSTWKSLDAPSATGLQRMRPAVGADADGRLHVFVVGEDDALWHRWQTPDGSWSPWASRGAPPVAGVTGCAAIVPGTDGLLQLFVAGTDGALWHIGQSAPDGGWAEWFSHRAPPGFVLLPALTTG